jgi:predicted nuclease of restriction endonuclease-like (RecB) superfamily
MADKKRGIDAAKFTSAEFKVWLTGLKSRIRQSQLKAAVRVNSELLRLYWSLGKDIVERKMEAGYGSRFFETLSRELRSEFPDMEGFSERNLAYTKKFYQFYASAEQILQQPVAKLPMTASTKANTNTLVTVQNRQQPVDEFNEGIMFQIPWGHHIHIFTHCRSVQEAVFYIRKTIENGWSRAVLMNFIEADMFAAQGSATNNFQRLLPESQSDLATEVLKDPYNFAFLTLAEDYRERELEDALAENIVKFLLELGRGFTFYGRQVPLKAGDEDLFTDMVFYHLGLRCFVVVELKARPLETVSAGQLGIYVAAVNHQLRRPDDNPTIGLLICKTKDDVLAQYALESSSQPIGISEYKLAKLLPKAFKSALPSVAEIEANLSRSIISGVKSRSSDKPPQPRGNRNA